MRGERQCLIYFCFNPSSHLLAMQMENGGILC
nr:MAG TPA: hypothetical protein [Caudoviricetes sp.]